MTDDPNCADYWHHKAANTRYCAHGVIQLEAMKLLREIADRYDAIADVVEREPITKQGKKRKRA